MTSVSYAPKEAAPQVLSAAAKPKAGRLYYLDTLRVILICLVIAQHTAITYGASGSWTYSDPVKNEITGILLTLMNGINQAFFMGLFFFVSGYFTPGSYDRKGVLHYWKDRLLRLGIPLILYTWLLNRIPNYVAAVASGHDTQPFLVYVWQTFLTSPDEGPTWFLFALLGFCLAYTLWRLVTRLIPSERMAWASHLKLPGTSTILLLGVVIAVIMFVVGLFYTVNETWNALGIFNLMVIYFPQYILFFIAGILAYRNDWLARLGEKRQNFWAWLSLGMVISLMLVFVVGGGLSGATDVFLGGLYWQSALFMLWSGLSGVIFSMALTVWLRDRKKPQSQVMSFAGPNSFGVYLIHPLILVPLSYGMSFLPIFPLIKFVIVLAATIVISFVASDIIRRIPGVKAVL
jgi:glucan biosynthesis protein C